MIANVSRRESRLLRRQVLQELIANHRFNIMPDWRAGAPGIEMRKKHFSQWIMQISQEQREIFVVVEL